jgi:Glycosyl transferase 4-like domain
VLYTSPAVAEGHLERATLGGLTTFVLGAGASWQEAKLQSGSRTAELAFATVLREWRPDVVHFQHLLFQSLRLPKIAVQASVPSVFTLHDFWLFVPPDQPPRSSPTAVLADQPPELCGMLRSVDSPFVLMAAALGLGTQPANAEGRYGRGICGAAGRGSPRACSATSICS